MTEPESMDGGSQIADLRRRFFEADRAGDMTAMGDLLADDVVILHPACGVIAGKPAVMAFMAQVLDEVDAEFGKQTAHETLELRLSGELAFERGRFAQTLTPHAGGDPHHERGEYLWIYTRTGAGRWQIARIAGTVLADGELEHREC